MARSISLIVYQVKDVGASTSFFNKFLGTTPYAEGAYYVGYKVGDIEVGLDPNSSVGPIGYTNVEDVQASLAELTEAGAEIVKDVQDVGGGLLIAQVKEPSGNVLGLRQNPKDN